MFNGAHVVSAPESDVPRLSRYSQPSLSDGGALRLRAAWLYYNRGRTQKEIAEALGVSRSTVIRMLDEARRRAEVQIWIEATPEDCTGMAIALEERYGLDEAVVVPGQGNPDETAADVGAALGRLLSGVITDGMTIGVTWGRTLNASLQTFRPAPRRNTRVISLLGGLVETRSLNPVDFSWQFASRLEADCMLYLAPLVVDSHRTKRTLIDKCGLGRLHDYAARLDLAIISCGDLGPRGSSLSLGFLDKHDLDSLVAAGAICDTGCHFLGADGEDIAHPIRDRVMNVDLAAIAGAAHTILASGGARRAPAIRATMKRTGCRTLVTDEAAAKALLEL